MPKVSDAIVSFLTAQLPRHPGPDLVGRYLKYGARLETQVNVAAGDGEPVADKRNTYSDGIHQWHSIRIPKNAHADPEFRDYELRFPLDLHAEAIGSTGWDWHARRSRWVGFDFDSITGHAAGVGVTADELDRIARAAQSQPYLEVRRSTGGAGLHFYVVFDDEGVPTANHAEHAALARCVLGIMSSVAGFDFASQIDACGGNMWLWHRKLASSRRGLSLVKAAERALSVGDLPPNWRDHIEVVTRRRAKIRIGAVADEHLDPFESLASSRRIVPLDEKHKAVMDQLVATGFSTVWVPDHHLLQTHTCALAKLTERKTELGIVGFFQTISEGRDPASPNCFLFPLDHGAWKVYRFSPGIQEAETWEQDGDGWTTCYFNRQPNLSVAAKAIGGVERPNNGGFVFRTAAQAVQVAEALGQRIVVAPSLMDRETVLKRNKDGRLIVEIQKRDADAALQGWDDAAKKDAWVKVFNVHTDAQREGRADFDNIIRSLATPNHDDAGWVIRPARSVNWLRQRDAKVKAALQSMGKSKTEAECIMGAAVLKPWTLVTIPFQPEYPGNRQWNKDAPQYRFQPADPPDDRAPAHAHWDRILAHIGQDLSAVLPQSAWACRENMRTGGDYLRAWIACVLRDPFEPTPYLFLFGPENSGKSIFHEAFELLVTKGVVRADRALTNQNDFNGELAGAVLCVVEEKDISKTPGAHNKIKDAVTSRTLSIRKMRTDSYQIPNMTHWVQCSNRPEACPIFPGDTRITMIYVPELPVGAEIPKKVLLAKLEDEGSAFMRTLVDLELPTVEGRLRLPVVNTYHKSRAAEFTKTSLEQFLDEECHFVPGALVPFADFFSRFHAWLADEERHVWSRIKVSRALPPRFPSGAYTNNKKFVGNLSWEESDPQDGMQPFIAVNGRLRLQEDSAPAQPNQ